ncbi:cold-regulated protein 27-like isoform X2 [Telopea speciosissima]|uniref:cold-regulated protein 27-like isoform X2 n=1 Tax=Telopea speciosissima TaxID=54955 RepID=UPI001CC74C34|nr:cold-regulated protein 27-like isoform X2 [Telopea speciosissima]
MEGNLSQGTPPPPRDPAMEEDGCRRTAIRTSSETSALTGDNFRGALVEDEEMDSLMSGSIFTEWTDEKHSLYLNSMEELFVKQLNDYKCCSNSKNKTMNRNNRVTSGQFKVFRYGCWQKINFERTQPQPNMTNVATKRHGLSINPWIQHFRCAGKQGEVKSAIPEENGSLFTQDVPLERTSRTSCGRVTSPKLIPAYRTQFLHQDSVESNTEVSDQNFIEEDHDGEKISSVCRTKRMKIAADVSSKDQCSFRLFHMESLL